MPKEKITLSLTKPVIEKLKSEAEYKGISASAIVSIMLTSRYTDKKVKEG